jgi:protein-tyrosine phosphatase
MTNGSHTVLFICTGNYYRSRFAEAVFNHHARKRGLNWSAFSRGLAIHLAEGDLSPHARSGLEERRIGLHHTAATRVPLTREDLEMAGRRIALQEAEHQPMMEALFPDWAARTEYWQIADLDDTEPAAALDLIEQHVLDLLANLAGRGGESASPWPRATGGPNLQPPAPVIDPLQEETAD